MLWRRLTTDDRVTPLGDELARLPAHPRLGRLLLAGAGMECCGRLRSRRRCCRSVIRFARRQHSRKGPRDYNMSQTGTVRTRSDVVDRVACLQAFHGWHAIRRSRSGAASGGARNVLRAAEQLFHLADFPRAERAERPDLALMQALSGGVSRSVGETARGTQDSALMVGGRGVRLDSSSRVRGEPLFLAIELNDAGGEARARQVSAVERDWLPAECFAIGRGAVLQSDARAGGSPRADVLGRPDARRDAGGDRRRGGGGRGLAQQARQQLERVLPAADTAAGKFLARVRWLAERAAGP